MLDRNIILQKLKDKTMLSYEEMQYLQQNPLTDVEAFNMVEDNPERRAQYEHYHNLRETIKDGNLTEHQLRGLVDIVFEGQNQDEFINSNTLYTSLRTKLYNDYRQNTTRLIDKERELGTYINSQYTVEYGEKPLCHHQLESISDKGRTILQQQTFEYNDDFRTGMLEPSIIDYGQRSPLLGSNVKPNQNNPHIADFQTYSDNNNMLNINNIDTNYANNIANAMQQIDPVIFNQQQALALQNQAIAMVPVMTKTMGGFIDALVLAAVVGFISGLGIWIAIILAR